MGAQLQPDERAVEKTNLARDADEPRRPECKAEISVLRVCRASFDSQSLESGGEFKGADRGPGALTTTNPQECLYIIIPQRPAARQPASSGGIRPFTVVLCQ